MSKTDYQALQNWYHSMFLTFFHSAHNTDHGLMQAHMV